MGNHEFDNGPDSLVTYLTSLALPALGACNIDSSSVPALDALLKKWAVVDVNGTKVGGWAGVAGRLPRFAGGAGGQACPGLPLRLAPQQPSPAPIPACAALTANRWAAAL